MCLMCEIKKKVAATAGIEIKETVLGTVTEDQLKELLQLEEAQEILEGQIQTEIKSLHDKGTEKEEGLSIVAEKYEKKYNDLQALKRTVIDEIRGQHGITIEAWNESKLNKKTLQIIQETAAPIETAPGVH